jgi:alpha-ribazole phosphatase
MILTLVRHTTVSTDASTCYGQSDVDVTATFNNEAEKINQQLHHITYDKVFTSPLQRCSKLALFCGYSQAEKDNRLMELNFGNWEGVRWSEIDDPNLERWYTNWIDVPTTNGESFSELVARVKCFLNELKKNPYQNVLIFTHAGVIRAMAILAGIVEIEYAFSDFQIRYGEIKRIDFQELKHREI